jgi:serine/threonine-protein kinase RsbW
MSVVRTREGFLFASSPLLTNGSAPIIFWFVGMGPIGESEGMSAKPSPWTLTIASDLKLLSLARAFVEAICQVAGCDEKTTHAVVLATDEATNNVMRHAHRDRPDAPIQIQCFCKPGEIEIRLLDEGAPFDITAVPHLDPAELRIGGRGVFLMRALMDELTCQPRAERGNTLRMVKRCPHALAVAHGS